MFDFPSNSVIFSGSQYSGYAS